MDDAATDGRKRKNYDSSKQSFGSRGHADSKKRKKGDLGRGEYFREGPDKRAKAEQSRLKRESDPAAPRYGIAFSQEEIAAEERRPKRKVAVLVGYAGTGYKGMQLTPTEKTIEGDLFEAFIKAGAISKANADDPKKASLVRCARTDKGVHAAGNVISLKLIVEDEGLVERVNGFLNGQIRVWGIVRTTNSFSAYQACDSRWYEYLIPTFAFLPPHPRSFLGRKVEEFAGEGYRDRQAEVETFWETVERERIAPLVEAIEEDIRSEVVKTLQGEEEANAKGVKTLADVDGQEEVGEEKVEEEEISLASRNQRLKAATRRLRDVYRDARRRYRISSERLARVEAALKKYEGTKNYHNYTVHQTFKDASSKRHIKSFCVNGKPILIGEGDQQTEWISLKVHGQSFMMHQIRKMIGMVAMLVRCGSDLATMDHSFGPDRYAIPRVPGLGLLLERPVFDSYNKLQAAKHSREPLLFSKYEEIIAAFKQKEIYERIYREESEKGEFEKFFTHLENFSEPYFLYVTSKGLAATV